MKRLIIEILDEIQADPTKIIDYKDNTILKAIFEYNYLASKAWKLPEGSPPYRAASEPMGMTPTPFAQTVRLWPNYSRDDLKPEKREALFIQLLESIHHKEAELIVAIKDGKLRRLYPFATHNFGVENGFLPPIVKSDTERFTVKLEDLQ